MKRVFLAARGERRRRSRAFGSGAVTACPGSRVVKLLQRAAGVAIAAGTAVLALSCASTGRPPTVVTAPSAEEPVGGRQFDEIRALWVIRYDLASPAAVRAVVEDAADSRFNTLLVQVRGRGDALYRSAIEPQPEFLRGQPDFDALQLTLDEAHARGMAVHAWVNAYLVWGPVDPPLDPRHLVNAHPEWLAVPRALGRELYHRDPRDPSYLQRLIDYAAADSHLVEGLYASPSHPEVQERLHAVWIDLATRYDLDGIHHDYIRYPTSAFDYSRTALEQFQQWMKPRVAAQRYAELVAAARDDPYAFADSLPDQWALFQRHSISDLVGRIYRDVKAVRPDLLVSAAVLPEWRSAARWHSQAWASWLADGFLDVAVPMAYTRDSEEFQRWIDAALAAAGAPERVWAGVGAYLNPVHRTVAQIDRARRAGVSGVAVFAFNKAADPPPAGMPPALQRIGRAAFLDP